MASISARPGPELSELQSPGIVRCHLGNCTALFSSSSSSNTSTSISNSQRKHVPPGMCNHIKAVEALAQHGEAALRPRKTMRGKWRKPLVSARKAAALRKIALVQGTYREEPLSDEEIEAGFIHFMPSWDIPGRKLLPKKSDRKVKMAKKRKRRVAEIEAKLAKQEIYLEKHRKALQDAKPSDFMDKLLGI